MPRLFLLLATAVVAVSQIADPAYTQLEQAYAALRAKLPKLLPTYAGKFALLKDGEIVNFFDTAMDAYTVGKKDFGIGGFSIQEVAYKVLDLGYFSQLG